MPAPHHSIFRPDALPDAQPTVFNKALKDCSLEVLSELIVFAFIISQQLISSDLRLITETSVLTVTD